MAPLTIRDDFGSSSPHNTAVVIGIVAGVMIALAFLITIVKAAARVPGSRLGSHVTPHPSGYESDNRLANNGNRPAAVVRSSTATPVVNNGTIMMRENNDIVMTLDNDAPRVASTSPLGEDSVPAIHGSASTPDAPTSPSSDGTTGRTSAIRTLGQTAVVPSISTPAPTAVVPAPALPDMDPPPPYSVA